uniref:JmjC domain-containing protein n=1 Tax=Arcella intermedia TaxID=1963864 RepID=A0A6B2LHZ0_9EUKA
MTAQEFAERYMEKEAFILDWRGRNRAFAQRNAKEALLGEFAGAEVVLSSANSFSYAKRRVFMGEYIRTMMGPQEVNNVQGDKIYYLFGDNGKELDSFLKDYVPPHFQNYTITPSLSWGLAGDGTGVPFHTHGAVFAEVLHGRKAWFLYKLGEIPTFDPNKTSLHWFLTEYPKYKAKPFIECVLEPEEVLYIPSDWFHSTLNVGQTVFISAFI